MILAYIKLVLLTLWILLFYGAVWVAVTLGKFSWRDALVQRCYRGILCVCAVRVRCSGAIASARPLLLVSNHVSYMDIPILGSQAPIKFTPKSEISAWPMVGSICRLTGSVFVDRRRTHVHDGGKNIASALAQGNIVSLFPEATTGNGIHLMPFKSAFFALADQYGGAGELTVQPVAIVYKSIRSLPIDITQWPSIAWYGDMVLLPHLTQLLALGKIDVELVFLPPVYLSQFSDRKSMAQYCHDHINDAINRAKIEPSHYSRTFSMGRFWSKSKS